MVLVLVERKGKEAASRTRAGITCLRRGADVLYYTGYVTIADTLIQVLGGIRTGHCAVDRYFIVTSTRRSRFQVQTFNHPVDIGRWQLGWSQYTDLQCRYCSGVITWRNIFSDKAEIILKAFDCNNHRIIYRTTIGCIIGRQTTTTISREFR